MSANISIVRGGVERSASRTGTADIDTSLLMEELRRRYQQTGKQVEVDFRKLVDWIRLGDQLTHQIHPYPAKLLPNIAHFFTRSSILNKPIRCVLDPFCGSGTVALEASLAGHTPYVADSNPLALLITKVKTTPFEPEALRLTAQEILSRAARFKTAPTIPVVNHHLWYVPDQKQSLEILLRAIMEIQDAAQQDFFRLCFSVAARRLSLADPAISVPVRLKIREKFGRKANTRIKSRLTWLTNVRACSEFARICEANIDRVQEANDVFQNRATAVVVGIDVRRLQMPGTNDAEPLKSGSVPLIITSPPYGSAQKYIRATSLSLNWLGLAGPEELSTFEGQSIGREHVPLSQQENMQELLPEPYERLINRVRKKNEIRATITRKYLQEMKDALAEVARVASDGGHIILVVGNNQVCGESLRNDEYITDVLQGHGLKLEISLIDHIKSRGLMTKRNRTASVISRESVLVFKK